MCCSQSCYCFQRPEKIKTEVDRLWTKGDSSIAKAVLCRNLSPCHAKQLSQVENEEKVNIMTACHHPKSAPVAKTKRSKIRGYLSSLRRCNTPVAVKGPRTLLAVLAAVLRPPTPSALGKLPCIFLPLPTLVVCALTDAASRIVFAA